MTHQATAGVCPRCEGYGRVEVFSKGIGRRTLRCPGCQGQKRVVAGGPLSPEERRRRAEGVLARREHLRQPKGGSVEMARLLLITLDELAEVEGKKNV
jgi:hypothetical protein